MADIIKLLTDYVANQIAAGEVVQRPASVVKELLENAIDAKATEIKLIVKDAGKSLIQIIDNGIGMSETDARMCFERHATSKITEAQDLFNIKTMGFRGEALASIAAVAQVELKTKKQQNSVGTLINIEGSQIKIQEPCQCADGTSFAIKNLFFNIPARRNFLKSDNVEFNHILNEFLRVSIAFPEIGFSLHHNGELIYMLEKGNLKQRLKNLFGSKLNAALIPVNQETNVVKITGFIAKPEYMHKKRTEQYLYANNRFIKHPFLSKAIEESYQELIPKDYFTAYFIFFSVNPQQIDINIHPTKTEVKFQFEQVIFSTLKSTIKHTLGIHNIMPTLDFTINPELVFPPADKNKEINSPATLVNPNYNPFKGSSNQNNAVLKQQVDKKYWENLYDNEPQIPEEKEITELQQQETITDSGQQNLLSNFDEDKQTTAQKILFQLQNKYIITQVKSGLIIIDQKKAKERIVFERLLEKQNAGKKNTQQLLFPQILEFSVNEYLIIKDLIPELKEFAFDIEDFGNNAIIIHGIPAEITENNINDLLQDYIEQYNTKHGNPDLDHSYNSVYAIALSIAKGFHQPLTPEAMNLLIEELFSCKIPDISPSGKPTYRMISWEEFEKMFR